MIVYIVEKLSNWFEFVECECCEVYFVMLLDIVQFESCICLFEINGYLL